MSVLHENHPLSAMLQLRAAMEGVESLVFLYALEGRVRNAEQRSLAKADQSPVDVYLVLCGLWSLVTGWLLSAWFWLPLHAVREGRCT